MREIDKYAKSVSCFFRYIKQDAQREQLEVISD